MARRERPGTTCIFKSQTGSSTPFGLSACDRHGPVSAVFFHQQRVGLPRTLSSPRTLAAYRPLWYGCLALGFSARCGAGFSPALHRASHPAHGPMLPGPVPPGLGWPSPCQMGSLVRRPLGPPPGALRWLLRFTPRLRVS